MAEWLVEEGIGEHRALLVDGGEARAAKIDWPGDLATGAVLEGKLIHFDGKRRRGTVGFAGGLEALCDRLPAGAVEGSTLRFEVTRPALAERGRLKRAQVRPTDAAPRPAPTLGESLGARIVRHFPTGLWEDVWQEAWSGEVAFPGGSITVIPTQAMTLVDVDGNYRAAELARACVPAIADAVNRMDLSGSIGIDFPTLTDKSDRRWVDRALDDALVDWPHERTAMNGFGFVQIVARVTRPSLLHCLAFDRAGSAARLLLRRAEFLVEPGQLLLTCHPAVQARLTDDWLAALGRRTGRDVKVVQEAALALDGGFAQAVSR
ncbi:ribonuclease [Tsuneonella sp. HG222]